MRVLFDYGVYSGKPLDSLRTDLDSLQPRPSYSSHIERIDGHDVEIVSVDVRRDRNPFEHFVEASYLNNGLVMVAWCKKTADYEAAIQISRSVRFKQH